MAHSLLFFVLLMVGGGEGEGGDMTVTVLRPGAVGVSRTPVPLSRVPDPGQKQQNLNFRQKINREIKEKLIQYLLINSVPNIFETHKLLAS